MRRIGHEPVTVVARPASGLLYIDAVVLQQGATKQRPARRSLFDTLFLLHLLRIDVPDRKLHFHTVRIQGGNTVQDLVRNGVALYAARLRTRLELAILISFDSESEVMHAAHSANDG